MRRFLLPVGRTLAFAALLSCTWILWTLVPGPRVLRPQVVRASGAFVQDNFAGPGSSSSQAVSTSSNTTAHNALVCIAAYSSGSTADFSPCTDTQGNNFQLYAQDAITGAGTGISVAFNIVGGADTLTCHSVSAHTTYFCYVMEVSGVYAVDSQAYKQGAAGTSVSYNTTTNVSGDFIVAGLWTSGNAGTITNGGGWSHGASVDWEYQSVGAAGSYTTNWTWTSSTASVSASVALLAGSNPTIGTSLNYRLSPLVQANEGANGTCVFPNNVTSGDILLVHASVPSGSTLTTPTDSRTTYTLVDSSSTQAVTDLWIGTASSSGADTVTFNGTYSTIGATCTELSSSLVTSTADFHFNGSFEGSPNGLSTPSGTATVNGDFLYLVTGGNLGSATIWPTSPLQFLVQSQGQMAADQVLGAAAPVTATFNVNAFSSGNYIILALKPAASITIFTSTCPSGVRNAAYSCSMSAGQGAGSYTWSISSGSLPTGLSISSSTGLISGTIGSAATTQTFTVQVTDGTHTTTMPSVQIVVNTTTNTPSFVQGLLSQLGTSLSFTSVSVGDTIWTTAETHVGLGSGSMACPADGLGTIFKFVGAISVPYNSNLTLFNTWVCMGQATSSGADTVSFASGQYTPAAMQVRGVQNFADQTIFTTGATTGTSQTFTSTSATTPSPNTLSLGAAVVNPSGTATSFAAQSPYTDAGNLLGDGNFVDLGYNVFSTVSSAAFASAITGSTAGYGYNVVMSNLRATTSGVASNSSGVPAVY